MSTIRANIITDRLGTGPTDFPQGIEIGGGTITGIATQQEAEAGTASDKLMTPQRTKQAIDELVLELSQEQVEDSDSTIFGAVSGQRLAQAVAEFAPNVAAAASVDSVGSYAFLSNLDGSSTTPGDTEPGSNLRYFGVRDTQVNAAGNIYGSAPSGTWRCMGIGNTGAGVNTSGTVWLRIS